MMTAFHLLESRLLVEIYNLRLVLSQIQNPQLNPLQLNQLLMPQMNLNPTLFHSIKPIPVPKPITIENSNSNASSVEIPPHRNASLTIAQPQFITTTSTPLTIPPPPPSQTISSTTESTADKMTLRPSLFPFLKSLPTATRKPNAGARDHEINKYNNTILSGKEVQVFTYFWKIENYTEKMKTLADSNSTDLYSSAFVISGLNLRIKASLNHLNRDFLYLRLEEIPTELIASMSSVILETGDDLFHEIETATMFRYKITVLDQSPKREDLVSQEFTDTTSGFMIPSSALTATDSYTKDNVILVKVILYL